MPSALGPAALKQSGIHIRQSPHGHVTTITYITVALNKPYLKRNQTLYTEKPKHLPSSSVITVMGSLNGPIPTTVAAAILTV